MWAHQAAWRRSVDSFWAAVWPGSERAWMPITSAGQTSHALRFIGLASCRVRGDRWVTSHTTAAGGRVSRQVRHCGGQGSLLGQTQHRSRLTCMHMPFISSHCTMGVSIHPSVLGVETLACTAPGGWWAGTALERQAAGLCSHHAGGQMGPSPLQPVFFVFSVSPLPPVFLGRHER